METEKIIESKAMLIKTNIAGDSMIPDFKLYYKDNIVTETACQKCQIRCVDQWKKNRGPGNKPPQLWTSNI